MCGRYSLHPGSQSLEKIYNLSDPFAITPSWNISPGVEIPVILHDESSPGEPVRRVGRQLFWGFQLRMNSGTSKLVANARSETAWKKPLFRKSAERRHAIVPASGFFEWDRTQSMGPPRPFWIHPVSDSLFHFAALWNPAKGQHGEVTILTCSANSLIGSIHHRMPVFLKPSAVDGWLSSSEQPTPEMLLEADDRQISLRPVSLEVNSTRNNHPGLIEEAVYHHPHQPDLFD
ncbi:MAG: SOS response-associated peptidase [Puniceicoccaceae bacterium]